MCKMHLFSLSAEGSEEVFDEMLKEINHLIHCGIAMRLAEKDKCFIPNTQHFGQVMSMLWKAFSLTFHPVVKVYPDIASTVTLENKELLYLNFSSASG